MSGKRTGIRPVSARQAAPEVKLLLKDIQDTMGIPWAPATWRSYAVHPRAMQLFWEKLKPAVATERFLRDSLGITERAYREVSRWYHPGYRPDLPKEELHRLQWELDAFEFGNPQLLIQQAVLSRAIRGEVVGGEASGKEASCELRHHASSYRRPELHLIGESRANFEVRALYRDIKETLGLPLVNSDYQALAKWPAFFVPAWHDAKPWRAGEEYRRLHQELAGMAQEAAGRLCVPVRIDERELRAAVDEPGQLEELRAAVELFTDLLPGLLLSDALFRLGAARGKRVEPLRPEGAEAPQEPAQVAPSGPVRPGPRQAAAAITGLLGVAALVAAGWVALSRIRESRP